MTCRIYTLLSGYGTWIEMSSTVTLLIHDQVRILFDSGAVTERNHLLNALAKLELTPDDIDIVANTHLHMDHCENNPLFSNAAWYCSDTEYENLIDLAITLNAWHVDITSVITRYLALSGGVPKTLSEKIERFLVRDAVPEKMLRSKRVDYGELSKLGIRIITTPGHTDGHISFACHDPASSTNIIIAGDAIVTHKHFFLKGRSLFTKDMHLAEKSKQKLAALSGWCLPGHGKAFMLPEKQLNVNTCDTASIAPPIIEC